MIYKKQESLLPPKMLQVRVPVVCVAADRRQFVIAVAVICPDVSRSAA
ncbi:hypothetical protein SAMN05216228_10681 [Rhizobium tibeticum]|uniref:Uncharacterized protein n=1 Tax=Rhizobium tibeticum TaxID=501024 RepID=A0ABY1AXS9_9HYPH|nr:hypothetical protein SAMN05216228_10681 [Rhizobium tibeticum]